MELTLTSTQTTIYNRLLDAQREFPAIKKSSTNPFFKNKYAGLESILEVVLPILHKHELILVQSPINDGDRVGVYSQIFDEKGDFIDSRFTVTLAKNDPQGAGSAITYCRRYALVAMLGLNVEDDDDGNHASDNSKQTIGEPDINDIVPGNPPVKVPTTSKIRR